jgi:hypothetical protein
MPRASYSFTLTIFYEGYKLKFSKVKGEAVPVLNMYHAMKPYGGVKVQLRVFLTSALDGVWALYFREKAPNIHWIGGCVARRNFPAPTRN